MAQNDKNTYLKSMLKDLEERVNNLTFYDRIYEISTYSDDLMTQVVITIESAIKHLQKVEDHLVNQINNYRAGIIQATLPAQESDDIKQELANFSQEVKVLTKRCLSQLDQQLHTTLTNEMIEQMQQEIRTYSERSRKIERTMRNHSFLNKFMKLRLNRLFFMQYDQIGRLNIVAREDCQSKRQDSFFEIDQKLYADLEIEQNSCDPFFLSRGLLAFTTDKLISVWDLEENKLVCSFEASDVNSLTELSSGYLVSGTSKGEIAVWDVMRVRQVSIIQGHRTRIVTMTVLKNGDLVSLTDIEDTIKIWKASSKGQLDLRLAIHEHGCWYNQLSELSNGFLVGNSNEPMTGIATIKIWDPSNGVLFKEIQTHIRALNYCVMSNDLIAVADNTAERILIFSPNEDSPCKIVGDKIRVIASNISNKQAMFELSDDLLITAVIDAISNETFLRIYNIQTGEMISSISFSGSIKAVSKDRGLLATFFRWKCIKIQSCKYQF